MPLITIEVPTPREMRGRWAALAAVLAAREWDRFCHADGPVWHYDDGGGNWCELLFLGPDPAGGPAADRGGSGSVLDGRAVLVGNDHEYTNTYYGEAARYFQEEETDILADTPEWWSRPVLEHIERKKTFVGFAYGFDGDEWRQTDYEPDDGFAGVGLPALSVEHTREQIVETVKPGFEAPVAAIDALVACDGAVDPEHVAAVFGPLPWDAAAGAAAARRFLDV